MPPKSKAKAPAARHPFAYTLDLFALSIDRLPPTFSAKRTKAYAAALAKFRKDPSLPYEEIQAAITGLGKESWPYRKAYDKLYAQYGRASEESFLLAHLDEGIRDKYMRFINEGGKLSYLNTMRTFEQMREPTPFERYFTPEEKFAIEQALLAARDSARAEINELVTNKKSDEYEAMVAHYVEVQKKKVALIDEMRQLTGVSPRWEREIADRIKTIEEGWSVVERNVTLAELEEETDYWKGTLQSFLHA